MGLQTDYLLEEEWVTVRPGAAVGTVQLDLWALVLQARYIPWRLEADESGMHLLVPLAFEEAAAQELTLFEAENRNWPPPPPQVRERAISLLPILSVLLLLASFHNITIMNLPTPISWDAVGSADATKIVDGEWWRAVTALTLHANLQHLLSNLAIGGILVIFLSAEFGGGLSWLLLLLSGFFGNMANAYLHPPGHNSIGSSTAVFGAVGIFTAVSIVRYRHHIRKRWRIPLAAGLALLALLGTEGRNTDVAAHLLGFTSGAALGLVAEYAVAKLGQTGRWSNTLLGLSAAAGTVAAWLAAFFMR